MVTVPFFCPDVPHLTRNPVFLYYSDNFQKPNPFQADVAVAIDSVIEKKLAAVDALESQFFEGGANGSAALIPSDPAKRPDRVRQVRAQRGGQFQAVAQRYRPVLEQWYGKEKAAGVRYAEAFEVCEYGRRPNRAELAKLFPFFGG
jgi:hypothetical protein